MFYCFDFHHDSSLLSFSTIRFTAYSIINKPFVNKPFANKPFINKRSFINNLLRNHWLRTVHHQHKTFTNSAHY